MRCEEELDQLNNELRTFRDNLKKDSISRRQDPAVTNRKLVELNQFKTYFNNLKSEVKSKVKSANIEIIDSYLIRISEKLDVISSILELRANESKNKELLDNPKVLNLEFSSAAVDHNEYKVNLFEMAQFDFKTVSSLLPKLNGEVETVHQLIEGIGLYEPSLNASSKPLLINYVLKACITYRDRIRMKATYGNIEELIVDLKKHFLPKQSSTVLAAKLQATNQGNLNIEEYGRSIEALMSDLTISQADNNANSTEIFAQANEKIAIDVFTRGIRDPEIRTILRARNYERLSEAVNAAKDESLVTQQNATLFRMQAVKNSQNNKNFRGRGKNFNRNFNHGHRTFNNRKNDSNTNASNYNSRNRNTFNGQWRNSRYLRGQHNNNNNNSHRANNYTGNRYRNMYVLNEDQRQLQQQNFSTSVANTNDRQQFFRDNQE